MMIVFVKFILILSEKSIKCSIKDGSPFVNSKNGIYKPLNQAIPKKEKP